MKTGSSASLGAALLAPKQPRRLLAVLDVVAVMAATLLIAAYLYPRDPLLLGQPFPWLWLAPVWLALRYGSFGALAASAAVLGAWASFRFSGRASPAIPEQFLLGGLILTLSVAQFADIWMARLKRARGVNSYLDQRLDALTRRHYLLQQDYERIEQGLLVKPVTLRQSLLGLRQMEIKAAPAGHPEPLPRADALLQLLAQACQLEVASLHADVRGHLQMRPAATLGDSSALAIADPMVTLALERNELCHVQTGALEAAGSKYLVAAPITDSAGNRLGLLLVERMPFLCLNTESLQLLNVVLGYYADLLNMAPDVLDICRSLPDCPAAFATELVRLDRVYRDCRIGSTVVALAFGQDHGERLAESLHLRRQLDTAWAIRTQSRQHALITLMPLYGQTAAQGYLRRLEQAFSAPPAIPDLRAAGISAFLVPVGRQPPLEVLASVLEKCHVLAH
jgi:hypothetical protein